MRKVELKTVDVGNIAGNDVKPVKFGAAIKEITGLRQEGIRVDELRQILRIHDAIDSGSDAGYALIEEADWTYLADRLKQHQFPFACRAFLELVDSVSNAESVEVTAAT